MDSLHHGTIQGIRARRRHPLRQRGPAVSCRNQPDGFFQCVRHGDSERKTRSSTDNTGLFRFLRENAVVELTFFRREKFPRQFLMDRGVAFPVILERFRSLLPDSGAGKGKHSRIGRRNSFQRSRPLHVGLTGKDPCFHDGNTLRYFFAGFSCS
ncbi:hypothetical protein SDC9_191408 [bioreactor metagenome]|uniref:Uncharacterized protein n=1 Tax=bioreactor metagenome TaxID=1076179 RepID=A0A645HXW9_9ZZZZ